eukprot:Pgem_evm1s7092
MDQFKPEEHVNNKRIKIEEIHFTTTPILPNKRRKVDKITTVLPIVLKQPANCDATSFDTKYHCTYCKLQPENDLLYNGYNQVLFVEDNKFSMWHTRCMRDGTGFSDTITNWMEYRPQFNFLWKNLRNMCVISLKRQFRESLVIKKKKNKKIIKVQTIFEYLGFENCALLVDLPPLCTEPEDLVSLPTTVRENVQSIEIDFSEVNVNIYNYVDELDYLGNGQLLSTEENICGKCYVIQSGKPHDCYAHICG